jgi:predicted small integral membrane protein
MAQGLATSEVSLLHCSAKMATMRIIRLCRTALVATVALFFTLVAFGNITDYGSNWLFVQHVMSMDTTFPDSTLRWRAIASPFLQSLVYWLIIAWEAIAAIVLWAGVIRLLAARSTAAFARAKVPAVLGLTMGFILYAVGFVDVGGEWFAMWQSQTWNGQAKAFQFLTMISAVMIILLLPDEAD